MVVRSKTGEFVPREYCYGTEEGKIYLTELHTIRVTGLATGPTPPSSMKTTFFTMSYTSVVVPSILREVRSLSGVSVHVQPRPMFPGLRGL